MATQEQALNRYKKIGFSNTLANTLVKKGFTSVVQLALIPRSKLEEILDGSDLRHDTVSSILKKARTLKAMVDNHLRTVRGQVSPKYKEKALDEALELFWNSNNDEAIEEA